MTDLNNKISDETLLTRLQSMVLELQMTNSIIDKKHIIKKYKSLKEILFVIYDKNCPFNVTADNIGYYYDTTYKHIKTENVLIETLDIFKLLNLLHKRIISGDLALEYCCRYIDKFDKSLAPIILKIFDKDLKCGISTKTIENIYNINISTFAIPLANNYKEGMCDFLLDTWYCSRKLDGFRCVIVKRLNEIKIYTRRGKEIYTLEVLKNEMLNIFEDMDIVLDGEICLIDENGIESFQDLSKEIKRKNHNILNPVYHVFDIFDYENFYKKIDNLDYDSKYNYFLKDYIKDNQYIKLLEQIQVISNDHLNHLITNALQNGWEGLMLRKDKPSKFKRSNNLLKVKRFKEIKLKVCGITKGLKSIEGIQTECIGSLEVRYKNNIVGVGSGLNDSQRILWMKDPSLIIGKNILIRYFRESINKNGKYSLIFPSLKDVL